MKQILAAPVAAAGIVELVGLVKGNLGIGLLGKIAGPAFKSCFPLRLL